MFPGDHIDPSVTMPSYDRTTLGSGIVHMGVGNFHRSHQAAYLDRLLTQGLADEWGICGVGVLPGDARMRDALRAQDLLYTLVLKATDGTATPRVIGSIVDYLYAPDEATAVLRKLADPATRIVSLTVTEGGYALDDATGEFRADDPAVVADLESGHPATVWGYIVSGLARRRAAGVPPYTVMSCDNLPGNGRAARAATVGFARQLDERLADWIDENVAFPDSMVDRITPVTTNADRAWVASRYGVEDAWPVIAEPFVQWVLQDTFPLGRPPLEQAGVMMVDDVEPYERMKLFLLNGTHQALSYVGAMLGHTYVHEAIGDPRVAGFVRAYLTTEALAAVPDVPGADPAAYIETVLDRFANPAIADTIARQVVDGSARMPKFVLPVIRHTLDTGGRPRHGAAIVASWAVYLARAKAGDAAWRVPPDPLADELTARAARWRTAPLDFVCYAPVFGTLGGDLAFVEAYEEALDLLAAGGAVRLTDGLAGH